jgi:hypothetical protein
MKPFKMGANCNEFTARQEDAASVDGYTDTL